MVAHLAWLDLETTGTDEHSDDVIEVGIVLTDAKLHVIADGTWKVAPQGRTVDAAFAAASPVVQRMHNRNGLWSDLAKSALTREQADAWITQWMLDTTGGRKHVGLAGSGVAHFDRRFIAAQLPKLDKALTYWSLDVGVVRRALSFCGRDDLIPTAGDGATKTHRALDDARQHLAEFRVYAELIRAIP